VTWNSWIVSIEIVRKCLFNTRLLFLFPLVLLRNSKVLFARAGDPLIECFGHANLGWLSTNNPACLQWVSSNICNFFSPPLTDYFILWCSSLFCWCSGMRPSDLLCVACEFRVVINEQSDTTTGRKFQNLQFFCLLSPILQKWTSAVWSRVFPAKVDFSRLKSIFCATLFVTPKSHTGLFSPFWLRKNPTSACVEPTQAVYLAFSGCVGWSGKNEGKRGLLGKFRIDSGVLRVARGGSGAKAPPLAARPPFHAFDVQLWFVGAQVCEPLIDCGWHVNFGWLSMNNPTWLQNVNSNTCKFQYLQKRIASLTSHFVTLSCNSCLPALRYATHWFIVCGMWISGAYQRTIWHDYRT